MFFGAAKRSFNVLQMHFFGKISRIASEEVTLTYMLSKSNVYSCCYDLEVCPLNISDLQSLDFIVYRFFCEAVQHKCYSYFKLCQDYFDFDLPSVLIDERKKTFWPVLK